MWLYLLVVLFVVIPALSYAACGAFTLRAVFLSGLGLIGLGIASFGLVIAAADLKVGLETSPELVIGLGILSIFSGMGVCLGCAIWKGNHRV